MERGSKLAFEKNKIKTLALENIHPEGIEVFQREGYPVATERRSLSEDELALRMPEIRVLGIRSKTQLNSRVLDSSSRLLAVGAFCIGTDQIDLKATTKHGVAVFNDPISNTRSVAELALGEIILLNRGIVPKSELMHHGTWDKTAAGATEVRGKTLGIVGYGRIGSQLSVLAEGMGMQVLYFDTEAKLPLGNARQVTAMEGVLKESDVVSIHVDGRAENENLIGADEINSMRDGVIFLNLSRGKIVDQEALAEAVRSGKVKGAAVDVFPEEPASNDQTFSSPLQGLPNVILTPHIAGSTEEAQARIGKYVAGKIVDFINTGNTVGSVNLPNVQAPPQQPNRHRLLHIHRNEEGVMAKINDVIHNAGMNIAGQHLETNQQVGYAIIDVDRGYDSRALSQLKTVLGTIRFRPLY
jgi:D-3-phosphoglycerate dehydrogenase / 2-oxoglutarate reductase